MLTVFFPAPGVKPYKARQYLLERRMGYMTTFGRGGLIWQPRPGKAVRTKQKNGLILQISYGCKEEFPPTVKQMHALRKNIPEGWEVISDGPDGRLIRAWDKAGKGYDKHVEVRMRFVNGQFILEDIKHYDQRKEVGSGC